MGVQSLYEMLSFEVNFFFISDIQMITLSFEAEILQFNRNILILLANYLIFKTFYENRVISYKSTSSFPNNIKIDMKTSLIESNSFYMEYQIY